MLVTKAEKAEQFSSVSALRKESLAAMVASVQIEILVLVTLEY